MSINDFFHVVEEVFDFIESFGGGVGVFPRDQILNRHAEGLGDFVRRYDIGQPVFCYPTLESIKADSDIIGKNLLCYLF